MLEDAVAALTMTGAGTIVAAMATEAWQSTRSGVTRLFRRGAVEQRAAVSARLDGDAELVGRATDPEGFRQSLVPAWQLQLSALIAEHPDAAGELADLVRQVRAALPAEGACWVQQNVARDHGRVFASLGGDVIVHQHPSGGPGTASADGERSERAGGT
ncbi:hypothetical protein AB0C96_34385 [Streptomyces sp. NPDC048506]|uniref:hypothetical protein n=1 Tax=Streptomyces sp. NPDC048506 TaxID=3155028 RepID=UPI00343223C8